MKKQLKLFIMLVLVLALVLSLTACNETEFVDPTPDTTAEPTVAPTVAPTVNPTKNPHIGGGSSLPNPDTNPKPKPDVIAWNGVDQLPETGTYVLDAGVSSATSENFTGKLILDKDYVGTLTIDMQKATVEVSGNIATLIATTGQNTLTFKDGSVIGSVTVNGGNVDVQNGVNIETKLEIAANNITTKIVAIKGTVAKVNVNIPTKIVLSETGRAKVIPTVVGVSVETNDNSVLTVKPNVSITIIPNGSNKVKIDAVNPDNIVVEVPVGTDIAGKIEPVDDVNLPSFGDDKIIVTNSAKVATVEELNKALTTDTVSRITFTTDINSISAIQISRDLAIDLGGNTLNAGVQIGVNSVDAQSYAVTISNGTIKPDAEEFGSSVVQNADKAIIISWASGTLNLENVNLDSSTNINFYAGLVTTSLNSRNGAVNIANSTIKVKGGNADNTNAIWMGNGTLEMMNTEINSSSADTATENKKFGRGVVLNGTNDKATVLKAIEIIKTNTITADVLVADDSKVVDLLSVNLITENFNTGYNGNYNAVQTGFAVDNDFAYELMASLTVKLFHNDEVIGIKDANLESGHKFFGGTYKKESAPFVTVGTLVDAVWTDTQAVVYNKNKIPTKFEVTYVDIFGRETVAKSTVNLGEGTVTHPSWETMGAFNANVVSRINAVMSAFKTTYYNKHTLIKDVKLADENTDFYVEVAEYIAETPVAVTIGGIEFDNRNISVSIGNNSFINAPVWKVENDKLYVSVLALTSLGNTSELPIIAGDSKYIAVVHNQSNELTIGKVTSSVANKVIKNENGIYIFPCTNTEYIKFIFNSGTTELIGTGKYFLVRYDSGSNNFGCDESTKDYSYFKYGRYSNPPEVHLETQSRMRISVFESNGAKFTAKGSVQVNIDFDINNPANVA